MTRNYNTLKEFVDNIHKLGYSLVYNNNIKVPCLYVDNPDYEKILKISYGKPNLIDTNLNIYDDGKHVFVDISIRFVDNDLEMAFLLYANETLGFFENLSKSGMLGIAPHESTTGNVFYIQLPNRDRTEKAFKMIKSKIK